MTFYSKNFDIHYTKDDLDYIPEIINFLTERIPELTNFFKLENLDTKDKPQIILYNNYNQFRNDCVIYNIGSSSYIVAFFKRIHGINTIRALNLKEQKKGTGHENDNLEKLMLRLLHEYAHFLHRIKINMPLTEGSTLWFIEGLATTITHQYDHLPLETTCNIEDITNQKVGYNTYRTLMTYLLQEYGQEFLLNILDKKDVQENLLPTICEEINHKNTLKK